MRHVYWIGGGSGAGKSTIARRLAERHGWRLYPTDDVMADHARRTTAEEAPLLHEFMAMDMDERWVNRSPDTMLETFHWFRGEAFELIVEDLLRMPKETGVVVEGFRLLPAPREAPAHRTRAGRLAPAHTGFPRCRVPEPGHSGRRIHGRDQRPGAGGPQPRRAGRPVHETPPRGDRTPPAAHRHRRPHDVGGRTRRAGERSLRPLTSSARQSRQLPQMRTGSDHFRNEVALHRARSVDDGVYCAAGSSPEHLGLRPARLSLGSLR